jgi:hypothetical protein
MAAEAADLGQTASAPETEISHLLADHLIAGWRGDVSQVLERGERMLAPLQPLMAGWLTALRGSAGDLEGAREAFAPIRADPGAQLRATWPWTGAAASMLRSALTTGDLDPIRIAYEALLGHGDHVDVAPPHLVVGPLATTLGLGALWLGRPDDALAHFVQARAVAERLAAPVLRAEAEFWAAAAELEARSALSDVRRSWLHDALATFEATGAGALIGPAESLLSSTDG